MIHIDFETRSDVDLASRGVYIYAASPYTDILCMAWAIDDGDVNVWSPGQPFPQELADAIAKGEPLCAWNANFERIIWREVGCTKYGFPDIPLEQWQCMQARAAIAQMPLHLKDAAKLLNLPEQKEEEGKKLIERLCKPNAVIDDVPQFENHPYLLGALQKYCAQDVRAERAAHAILPLHQRQELEVYWLDQRINDRGVMFNLPLVHKFANIAEQAHASANERIRQLTTGFVRTVQSSTALVTWLQDRGYNVTTAAAKDLEAIELPNDSEAQAVIDLRLAAARSSPAKLKRILETADENDWRVRGLFQYHGAGPGRWTGRSVQVQNFPRAQAGIDIGFKVLSGDDIPNNVLSNALEIIARNLRRLIIASEGRILVGGDYANIEARVLAWCADHKELLDAFRHGDDIYVQMAAVIFGKPENEITKSERQIGKMAILGLGYGMGHVKFGERTGLKETQAKPIVELYRRHHAPIPRLWRNVQQAAGSALEELGRKFSAGKCSFQCATKAGRRWLLITLPSGRRLYYYDPQIRDGRISYAGRARGLRIDLYGGKLVENIVQAIARDLLAEAMLALERAGLEVILHVHDEIVCECCRGAYDEQKFREIVEKTPQWAAGLPIKIETFSGMRYEK